MKTNNTARVERWVTLILVFGFVALTGSFVAVSPLAAQKKTKVDTPVMTCGTRISGGFMDLILCAPVGTGATGAPAGFSIQWQTLQDFNTLGWPTDSNCPLDLYGNPTCGASFCKAGFSGKASGTSYNLRSGECVTVRIGDLLFDNGASTSPGCAGALDCSTHYVFRAFAHASKSLKRSDFTSTVQCTTGNCSDRDCTVTQEYWRTHDPIVLVTELSLGNVTYSSSDLVSILNQQANGNGLISLAHQLITAKLNVRSGARCPSALVNIDAADALIGDLVIPPFRNDSLDPSVTSNLVIALNNFNNGAGGDGCPLLCSTN